MTSYDIMSSELKRGLLFSKPTCVQLVKKYPQFAEIFEILFNNTQYYTRQQVSGAITRQIHRWLHERQPLPLFVILTSGKIGSEHYFYYHFKDQLPKHQIISNETEFAKELSVYEAMEVLFLDDWCLSGVNTAGSFESIAYKNLKQLQSKSMMFTSIFAISTLLCSQTLESLLADSYSNVTSRIYSDVIVERFDVILKNSGQIFDHKLLTEFTKTFSPDTEDFAFPIHLDYKVANQFGSYPTIYLMCRDPPNKDFIKEVEEYFKGKI